MCTPAINPTTMLIQGGLAGLNFIQERAATKAFNNQVMAGYMSNLEQIRQQQEQIGQQAAQQKSEIVRKALQNRATIIASIGEGNAFGNSSTGVVNTNRLQEQEALNTVDTNVNNELTQSFRQAEGLRQSTRAQLKSKPSLLGLGLQLGGSALSQATSNVESQTKALRGR